MKKKGFTLIELLAVIVILAIIALIATPLVLKYIEYSKERSAKLSANTYAEAVEKEYVSKLTSNEKMPNKEYTIKELDELGVKLKGDKPEGDSDTVTLKNGNVIEYILTINGYVLTYEDGETKVESEKDDTVNSDGLLDHTVKFMVDGELYEAISVKDGNPINAPLGMPTSPNGNFSSWLDSEGNEIKFPYTPNSSTELTALFQQVRKQMEVSDADTLLFSVNDKEYIKTKDGTAILGQTNVNANGKNYVNVFLISKDIDAVSTNTNYRLDVITYNNETWYSNIVFTDVYAGPIVTGVPPYECDTTSLVYVEEALDILDTYFIKN